MTVCVAWILDRAVCLLSFTYFFSIKAETAVYSLIIMMMEQTWSENISQKCERRVRLKEANGFIDNQVQ